MDVTKSFRIAFKGLKNGRHTFDFEVGEALFEGTPRSRAVRAARMSNWTAPKRCSDST